MTAPRPTFRIMRNGYDRFAVDDAVEQYAAQVEQLGRQLQQCQAELQQADRRMNELRIQYQNLEHSMEAQKQAAEQIARLSLREANEIINTAQQNADAILKEALRTARLILADLSRLYGNADHVKADTKQKLEALIKELDAFQLPKMPDLKWLEEAEKQMR